MVINEPSDVPVPKVILGQRTELEFCLIIQYLECAFANQF